MKRQDNKPLNTVIATEIALMCLMSAIRDVSPELAKNLAGRLSAILSSAKAKGMPEVADILYRWSETLTTPPTDQELH